jgi:hypoxanthine phosphoribosyltransferase
MNSAFKFFSKLLENLQRLQQCKPRSSLQFRWHFVKISSYVNEKSVKVPEITIDGSLLEGRDIIVIEDMVDSGTTIEHLRTAITAHAPASLKFATLLHKRNPTNLRYD